MGGPLIRPTSMQSSTITAIRSHPQKRNPEDKSNHTAKVSPKRGLL